MLEFKSHIVQEPLNIVNPQFGMQMSSNGFDAHVQATVPLQHTDDRGWVGEGEMRYETRTMTQRAQCEIRIQGTGTTTFHVGDAHAVTEGGGWSSAFSFTRFRTFNWNKKGYEIGGWTPVRDSDVIAKKTISVNCSTGMSSCREETTLILRLADEPGANASQPK